MSDFLEFVNDLVKRFPLHVEIYYSRILGWCITITKEGCAQYYPNAVHCGEDKDDVLVVEAQGSDMNLCFAKAHVALKEWMIEHNNGY